MNDSMNVSGKPINIPDAPAPRTRSTFDLGYHFFNTERFGEYGSNFVMDCVEGDRVPIRSSGSVHSYTLKAPLMQSISKKKDYYQVPLMAMIPKNFDKWYTNPVVGDDCPDDCGLGVENFWHKVYLFASNCRYVLDTYIQNNNSNPVNIQLIAMLRGLVSMEYFYSNGSLISSLGCHGSRFFRVIDRSLKKVFSFDQFFDRICTVIVNNIPWFSYETSDGIVRYCINDPAVAHQYVNYACTDFRTFLQYLRDDLNTLVYNVDSAVTIASFASLFHHFFTTGTGGSDEFEWQIDDVEQNYNLSRLWAYQLVCAHFYSNDHVDYIYSAELYRQLINYYVVNLGSNNVPQFFTMNGLKYEYDALSAKYFDKEIDYVNIPGLNYLTNNLRNGIEAAKRGYLSALLSYRRSLRYVDYFTGSRTRPLAVGDVNVDVQTGSPNYVNVVDVTRNIQRQRFFNAVNRFGRKFEEYIKGLSGITPQVDYHNPLYIAHTSDTVYGTQVENTGSDQLSMAQTVTSRLVSSSSRYMFEFNCDRPSVIIGITYYDIPRAYLYSCERQLMHINRFDMFNPYMQFIGDQSVYYGEIGSNRHINYNGAFGYQTRHMEYKQRYLQASGGFVENLPGYIFDDASDAARVNSGVLTDDFIRSLNTEIDKFYVSLTGYSLGSYFHFIVDNDNSCDASRPMAYSPSIL